MARIHVPPPALGVPLNLHWTPQLMAEVRDLFAEVRPGCARRANIRDSSVSRSHPVTLTDSSRERGDNRVGQVELAVRESSTKALQVPFLRRSAARVPGARFGSPHRAGLPFLLTYVRVPLCR